MRKHRKIIQICVFIQVLSIATVTYGVEYDAQIRSGVGVSDNIARTPENEQDETIISVGFIFGVTEQTNKLDLDVQSQFDYLDYSDDTFDSELVGGLNGLATFTLIDERLKWVIQETFGQSLSDPLQPSRPDNRENVNFFTTGPSLWMMPASRNPIVIDVRYSRINYEFQPHDNERLSGALSIGREVSRGSILSINMKTTRIEFDNDDLRPPIDIHEAFGRFEKIGNLSTLSFELGYNEVESAGNTGDGILARVAYTRETSANGIFSISAGSEFSEEGNIFRFVRDSTIDQTETTDNTVSSAPFEHNYFTLTYRLEQERYSVNTLFSWNQENYEGDQGDDRDVYRGNLIVRRDVSRTVFVGLNIGLVRQEYPELNRRDDDLMLGVNIGYRFSAGFNVSLQYQNFQRNSLTPGADFTENRAFIRLAYTPVWSR